MVVGRRTSFIVVFIVLIGLFGAKVDAWGCAGHMITAEIAQQLLPTNVRRYFTDISAYQQMYYPRITSMTEASCWPDDMKSYTSQYSAWHYFDVCFLRANGTNMTCPVWTPAESGEMPTAVANARAQLAMGSNLTHAESAFWLTFLVHLVGDFHQPLHIATLFNPMFPKGDQGGNRFYIYVNNSRTNLHAFHDDLAWLLPRDGFPQRPLAEYPDDVSMIEGLSESLILLQKFAYPSQPNVTNTSVWIEEGFETGVNISYTLPNGQDLQFNQHFNLSDTYVTLQKFAYPSQPNVTNTSVWIEEGFETGVNISYTLPNGQDLQFNQHFNLSDTYVTRLRSMLQNKLALGGRRLARILMEIYDEVHA
ncbi:single-strand-specific nuclease, putative [Bodo saltans]|uniref:Single-strand-specific nuclease, putative n=1 Tax=Bodo saltans TaxID=75058 RepID=A0A0S4JML7_BODSA|nr:single-strand-specific nuclease, putative [Bodo saltans]|eukprot:CUG90640.1 single-strand-specific nuclease, putative [Bodo saltans]